MGSSMKVREQCGQTSRCIISMMLFLVTALATGTSCYAYSVNLQWDPNREPGVAGYKVYYRTDTSELPFNGTGATEGTSPVDVGNFTGFSLSGLDPGKKYYIAVTAYDGSGVESPFSNIVELPVSTSSAITVPALVNNMQAGGSTLVINGTVSDADGIRSLTINGITVAVASNGSFSLSLHLAKGANTITFVVTDNLNNQTVDTKIVTLTKSDAPSDFDGDGRTDLAVWRSQYGMWYVKASSTGSEGAVQWGTRGDFTVSRDYDGDGLTDSAVWRPSNGTWYVIDSSSKTARLVNWGTDGDIPVPADYDGDGKADMAVWRPSEGRWYVIQSTTGAYKLVRWGTQGDTPMPADYDGDGKADMAVWRPSEGQWYIIQSSTGTQKLVKWGVKGDIPAAGYYDGDGKADMAVWRPSEGQWYILQSSTGTQKLVKWGTMGDIPVPGDFDGDGKTDLAVWRPADGNWYITASSTGAQSVSPFGLSTDQPAR